MFALKKAQLVKVVVSLRIVHKYALLQIQSASPNAMLAVFNPIFKHTQKIFNNDNFTLRPLAGLINTFPVPE